MNKQVRNLTAVAAVLTASQLASAGTEIFFNPLTQSGVVADPNSVVEMNSPWLTPPGITQENLTSMDEIEADIAQSVVRVDAGTAASMFDMIAFDEEGENLFIPHETPFGAGVTRYHIQSDFAEILFNGDLGGAEGDWTNDYAAFDPSTYTPWGTVLLGEEWSGEGRLIEVTNPSAPAAAIEYREVETIANVAHEGLRFSADGNTLYYVDEWNSGSIYKFVSTKKSRRGRAKGGLEQGQTFVLRVDAFEGVSSDLWNDESNEGATRTGWATWVPITDEYGNALTETDPFLNGPTNDPRTNDDTRGGRPAADEAGATPYGRPEDMEVGKLANGNEVMYFAATSERTIYSVEMVTADHAIVRVAASDAETPKNLGFNATSAELNSPDNLAQDALGNIYIIEDAPNSSSVGGDIWFMRDADSDGVAESVDHFLTLQVAGSEATGMIFNPKKPTQFVVAIQHPSSTDLENVPEGFGDAVWAFDLKNVAPPPCEKGADVKGGKKAVVACTPNETNFVKKLRRAGKGKSKGRRGGRR